MREPSCPSVKELLSRSEADAHEADCAACSGVITISGLRSRGAAREAVAEECAEYEPQLAALIDGSIEADELEGLAKHLDGCGPCSRVLLAVAQSRDEIDRLTRDRTDSKPGAGTPGRPDADEPTSGLVGMMLRPTRPWIRGVQLAAIAALAVGAGLWLGRGTSPDTTAGSSGERLETSSRPGAEPAATAPDPNTAATGVLHVRCRPRCDAVTVDSVRYGPSPIVQHRVPEGLHSVQLVRQDASKRVVVRVGAQETTTLIVEMAPVPATAQAGAAPPPGSASSEAATGAPGHLSVSCTPACTAVLLDGESLGASPVTRRTVSAGPHRLELRAGSVTRSLPLFVEPGQTTDLHAAMAPPAG